MAPFSMWHGLIVIFYAAVIIIPSWRILQRAGHSGWWSVLFIVPFVNLAALWIFAFVRWPATDRA